MGKPAWAIFDYLYLKYKGLNPKSKIRPTLWSLITYNAHIGLHPITKRKGYI